MKPEVIIEPGEDLARRLICWIDQGPSSLALPGGSVATTFFPALVRADVDWSGKRFFWGDERAVPPDHPESNYGLARALLLDHIDIAPGQVHRMRADAADLEAAAQAYEATLVRQLGDHGVLDLALVGLGPDGHVCSLFPGHPLLEETRRRVAAIVDSPKQPPRRLTLTLPFLAASRLVAIAALGAAKAEVVREAIEDPLSPLPVARLARAAKRCSFLLDAGAGSLLS